MTLIPALVSPATAALNMPLVTRPAAVFGMT
jgi:hypothetical protein